MATTEQPAVFLDVHLGVVCEVESFSVRITRDVGQGRDRPSQRVHLTKSTSPEVARHVPLAVYRAYRKAGWVAEASARRPDRVRCVASHRVDLIDHEPEVVVVDEHVKCRFQGGTVVLDRCALNLIEVGKVTVEIIGDEGLVTGRRVDGPHLSVALSAPRIDQRGHRVIGHAFTGVGPVERNDRDRSRIQRVELEDIELTRVVGECVALGIDDLR